MKVDNVQRAIEYYVRRKAVLNGKINNEKFFMSTATSRSDVELVALQNELAHVKNQLKHLMNEHPEYFV